MSILTGDLLVFDRSPSLFDYLGPLLFGNVLGHIDAGLSDNIVVLRFGLKKVDEVSQYDLTNSVCLIERLEACRNCSRRLHMTSTSALWVVTNPTSEEGEGVWNDAMYLARIITWY